MATKVSLSPEELISQSKEMSSLAGEYDTLFNRVIATLNDTNNNWSENLAHNFASKIATAQKGFQNIVEMLNQGAQAANNSAVTFQSVDSELVKIMSGTSGEEAGAGGSDGSASGSSDNVLFTYNGRKYTLNDIKEIAEHELKQNWKWLGEDVDKFRDWYYKQPEVVRKVVEKIIPPDLLASIKITGDIVTGDSAGAVTKYVDAIAPDNQFGKILSKTTHVTLDNDTYVSNSYQEMQSYMDTFIIPEIKNGDYSAAARDLGRYSAMGAHTIIHGSADVVTELAADGIDGAVSTIRKVAKNTESLGSIIPGPLGDYIEGVGEGAEKVTSGVSDFLRNLF